MCSCRCFSDPDDLDAGGPPRILVLTEALLDVFLPSDAWDEWGIDSNISVSIKNSSIVHKDPQSAFFQPFTDNFPQVDIRQLIAPDILHQLIKGTFKDHLVEWVSKYLELVYGKAGTAERLAEIDRQ